VNRRTSGVNVIYEQIGSWLNWITSKCLFCVSQSLTSRRTLLVRTTHTPQATLDRKPAPSRKPRSNKRHMIIAPYAYVLRNSGHGYDSRLRRKMGDDRI
jgi:hypothetical protein